MKSPSEDQQACLSALSIRKTFGGTVALDGVDLKLRRGEVHALMGENGAGKSTLIKALTGFYAPDAGSVTLNGHLISPKSPLAAQNLGISTVYQEVNLIPALSIAENISLGRQPKNIFGIDWKAMNLRAEVALARLGLKLNVHAPLQAQSVAVQQLVAIARALDVSASVLILDEPTASLDADEVKRLFEVLKKLRSEGLAILFVTHFLDQVYEISDRITVLRNGKTVGEYLASQLTKGDLVARMMGLDNTAALKSELKNEVCASAPNAVPFLELKAVARKGSVNPIDLSFFCNESLGLAGLLGSGRS
ncbi:MAG: sugar ABC transporter ATP-binding protein, partial [Bdellovibrionales bacterium]|nr:sugar ABC transporter ATP-binding protein [Oligoflexia bacterium]